MMLRVWVNIKKIITPLLEKIDIQCYLTDYLVDELILMLKQRCQCCNLEFENDEVLKNIAENSGGSAGRAVRILKMSYRVMRSRNEEVLKVGDVEKAVKFCPKVERQERKRGRL